MRTPNYSIHFLYNGTESTCFIEPRTEKGEPRPVPIAKATIKRFIKDPENRSIARFKSLTKATRLLPKSERYEIWEAFRTNTKIPRWSGACIPKSRVQNILLPDLFLTGEFHFKFKHMSKHWWHSVHDSKEKQREHLIDGFGITLIIVFMVIILTVLVKVLL